MNGARCSGSDPYGTTTFTDHASCTGSATACSYAAFTGESSCKDSASCIGATFSGESSCDGGNCKTIPNHTTLFTEESSCTGTGQCYGAVFSGNSTCTSTYNSAYNVTGCSWNGTENGISLVSTFKDNAVCGGTGCDSANYENKACCSSCTVGSGKPQCGTWSEATQSYDAW